MYWDSGAVRCGVQIVKDREVDMNERIEALEQQVASLPSALAAAKDILGNRISPLEAKLKGESDQQDEAA